jgi:hypothetical protein
MFATNPSLMVVYCHVVIFAETMDRDLEKEELLGDIIRDEGDITLSFLNDTDGQEREDDGSGNPMEEEGDHDDGSGDRMEEEGDHDSSDDRTEVGDLTVAKSGEVYIHILIKPLLT